MELYGKAPPAAIGIPSKLLPQGPEATGTGTYPYRAAAQELGLLVLESCPQKKLECIGERRAGERGEGRAQMRRGRGACAPVCGMQVLLSNGT